MHHQRQTNPIPSQNTNQPQQQPFNNAKIQQLRQWMKQKGCIIHPHVQIPSFINGYQGVAATAAIPPKTLIVAIPSSLIMTVTKCYKDPALKSVFVNNDDLFDYEASDDAQFNVLCVFLMYHKLHIEKSQWRIYLETIGEPETAIDWADSMLKGLNKSVIEEIIHVRIQCDKLRVILSQYLITTPQFSKFSLAAIQQTFNYCYRAVMTRCFGYYFGQASLIPIADLINHGCEVVDHQLVNVKYEKGIEFHQAYTEKSDKIDCSLLGIKRGKNVGLPYRERFLLENQLVDEDVVTLAGLDRARMDKVIGEYNNRLIQENQAIDVQGLQFCQEDDSEDNDTDAEEQQQRQMQLQRLQLEELEQVENFKKYFDSIKVETYKQVQDRFESYEKELGKQQGQYNISQTTKEQSTIESRNDLFIKGAQQSNTKVEQSVAKVEQSDTNQSNENGQQESSQHFQTNIDHPITVPTQQPQQKSQPSFTTSQQPSKQSLFFDRQQLKPPTNTKPLTTPNQRATVPVQMVQSSSQSQSQDDEEWGLQPQSYFTLSTRSAVGANQQLFNSYGSRTNKFLLVWYGFCYRNNIFDSVSLRLHVQFHKTLPSAKQVVLDTYIGGQGLSFRKDQKEIVQGNQVSRQFRLKMNKLCTKLLTFIRLYLLDYYKGKDLYKLCVTIPSSVEFQLFVLQYFRGIVVELFQRYPLTLIEQLKKQMQSQDTISEDKGKIHFKIIYLEEQRKILQSNIDTVNSLIKVWKRIENNKNQKLNNSKNSFDKSFYKDLTIHQLRKLKPYLTTLKNNFSYVIYQHQKSVLNQ